MRFKNFIRNTVIVNLSTVIIVILGILSRKVLLDTLGVNYVGFESTFRSLFSLLSFSELGVASVVSFRLYKALAEDNKEDIEKILSLFKCLYLFIGLFVLSAGLLLAYNLPLLLEADKNSDWNLLKIIFFFQLGETLCTYFLSYRRTLYIANQEEYVCAKVDLLFNIVSQILQIAVLILYKNYVLYLGISLLRNTLSNILITWLSKRKHGYNVKLSTGLKEIKDKEFWSEIKNFSIQKIALLVWSSSDNLIIMYYLGSRTVGVYANYLLITGQVRNIVNGVYKAATAAVGNYVYQTDKSQSKDHDIFNFINMGCFAGASFAAISLIILLQPTVGLFFGKQYLISDINVFLIGIILYIEWSYLGSYIFRSTFGNFKYDRTYMCLSAITNVVISILGAKFWGLFGVLIGTLISSMFIYWGRFKFVIHEYLNIRMWPQLRKRAVYHLVFLIEFLLSMFLYQFIGESYQLVGGFIICLTVPNGLFILFFHKSHEFSLLKNMMFNLF